MNITNNNYPHTFAIPSRAKNWIGYTASIWAFAFAALSFYWAVGGTLGADTLGNGIKEMALARDPEFVLILWVTAVLKFLLGILALALVQQWGHSIPKWMLLIPAWGAGLGMTLYGGVGLIKVGLMKFGVMDIPELLGAQAIPYYIMLWEPIWLVGGILFTVAVWRFSFKR